MSLSAGISFSYRNPNGLIISLDETILVKVSLLDPPQLTPTLATISFVDAADQPIEVPEGCTVEQVTEVEINGQTRFPAPRVAQQFIIEWANTYELMLNGQLKAKLSNQRKQGVFAKNGARVVKVQAPS